MTTTAIHIGKKLRNARLAKNIKAIDVANNMKKSLSYYYNLEKGKVPLNALHLRRAYDVLGIEYNKDVYTVQ